MRLMTHVRRSSNGGFEVRIVVPADCRKTIGRTNLTQRLGQVSKSEANRIAAPIIAKFRAQIEDARSGAAIKPDPMKIQTNAVQAIDIAGTPSMSQSGTPMMVLFDGYCRERQPSASTLKRWRPVITNLVEHIGHDDASRFTADDIVAWKEGLAGRGVNGRTIREVYLAAVKVVFGWSVENRKLASNPAIGVTVRVPKKMRLRDPGFTAVEAGTILRASVGSSVGGISIEHARARQWNSWLCAYSGARVGEIAQLRGCDVFQVEKVWVMRITPDAGSTKSGAARLVPIHQHLVEQGLLEMVEGVGAGALFYNPGRARGGSLGNPHHKKIGQRLALWVRELGVVDPDVQPNHGWRHLFKTIARRAGVAADARDAIQGHAPRSIGESDGDWPVDVLADAMAKFPRFDFGQQTHDGNSTSTAL